MKIAWFTPFSRASAIGRFSRLVTEQLASKAKVDLWITEAGPAELHETSLRVVRHAAIPDANRFLAEYDVIVYNLGDHAPNHGPIYTMSRVVPGIVILHDYVMHHFFASYYDDRGQYDYFLEILRRRYNAQIELTPNGWDGPILRLRDSNDVIHYPLFEEAITLCTGIVTHSEFVRNAVERAAGAPVTSIPLAWEVEADGLTESRAELGIPEDRSLAVTVGHVNENKRIQMVMEALAANRDLASSIVYVVVGGSGGANGPRLERLVQELKLEDTVRFTGYAPDDKLRSYLRHADFCINLRWPAMEGGSASCVEQMLHGKAVIVTDTGVYSELPDSCVRKVRPEHELEDLARYLRELAANPALCETMGKAAREYAEATFSPGAYATRFLQFCASLAHYKPAACVIDAAAAEMRRMGATSDMAIVDTVSKEIALLMDGKYDSPILRETRL
jgi:glycosyltransferase involved in cell wall biosynthesis